MPLLRQKKWPDILPSGIMGEGVPQHEDVLLYRKYK